MGKCTHHPQTATRENEGVCSSCLQKKLNSVRRGESSGHSDATTTTTTGAAPIPKHLKSSLHSKEAIAVLGSIASITKRRHSSKQASTITTKGRDTTEAGMDFVLDSRYSDGVTSFRKPVVYPSSASFHHARVNFTGLETSSRVNIELPSVKDFTKRRSKVASLVSRKAVGKSSAAVADAKFGTTVNSLRSVECRSPPLVDRIAKETALRVIKEVGDDNISEGDGGLLEKFQEQDPRMTCFSPGRWQSKLRSKWGLKGLGAPIPASNKIFPSKSVENVQKLLQAHFSPVREESRFVSAGDVDQQRRALQQPTDLNPSLQLKPPSRESESPDVVIEGMPDRILKPEDMNQRLRTSYNTVLKWLQVVRFSHQICETFHFCPKLIERELHRIPAFSYSLSEYLSF